MSDVEKVTIPIASFSSAAMALPVKESERSRAVPDIIPKFMVVPLSCRPIEHKPRGPEI